MILEMICIREIYFFQSHLMFVINRTFYIYRTIYILFMSRIIDLHTIRFRIEHFTISLQLIYDFENKH